MMRTLPPAASRALALLILLAAIGIIYLGVVGPLLGDYGTTQASIEEMRNAIERYRRVGAELPARRAELTALRQSAASSEGFLQGTNDALVAAQIQNRIKSLVEAGRGDLKSTQVIPTQDEGKYRRVTVRAQMNIDIAGAQRVLHGIETASPLLFLDNLDIRSRIGERRRATADESSLDVRFDVYGYMRGGKSAGDKPSIAAGAAPLPAN
jgi:general secretion pathway protein M